MNRNFKRSEEIITITASYIRETKDSLRLDCEGDSEWFPKSQVTFDAEKNSLSAPRWLLEQKFPDTKF